MGCRILKFPFDRSHLGHGILDQHIDGGARAEPHVLLEQTEPAWTGEGTGIRHLAPAMKPQGRLASTVLADETER
ncbi:MAG TPA: hypothetical protein DCP11_14400 [Microbacteriaceae bacterium]|nr:hypothetical protein [Microbacteriaceae bacterium]